MKRIYTIAAISGSAAFALWRVREQGKLETAFLEHGVDPDLAKEATEELMPFLSLTTYTDVVGSYSPQTQDEWNEYALAASGAGLVLL